MKQIISCIVVSIVLAHGGGVLAQCCTCDGDVNGDGTLNPPLFGPDDAELVLQCFQGDQAACAACVVPDCDVDCDGVTSFDDVNAVLCMFQAGGSPNLSCCGGGRGGLPLCECNFDSECAAEQQCINNACGVEESIPTVSEWGMALLVLLVLTAGSVVFRWR